MSRLIKIIRGTYGWRPAGAKYVKPVGAGDGAIRVNDDKAADLVARKIAVYADAQDAPAVYDYPEADEEEAAAPTANGNDGDPLVPPTEAELDGMTVAALRETAEAWGVDLDGITLKADILAALKAYFEYV